VSLDDKERAPPFSPETGDLRDQELRPLLGRLEREFRTMQRMVEIYCADHHRRVGGRFCEDCDEFLHYAGRRLEKCPYGEGKPTCARCPIHCYKRTQRERAKQIMRYAGPRMTWRHPYLALMHLLDKVRKVEHPLEVRRRGRG
jgi:hypothetical protein